MKRKIFITFIIVVVIILVCFFYLRYYKLISYIHVEPMPSISERIEHFRILSKDSSFNWKKFGDYYGYSYVVNLNSDNSNYNLLIMKNNENEIINFRNNIEFLYTKIDTFLLKDGKKVLYKDIFSLNDFLNSSIIENKVKKEYINDRGLLYIVNNKKDSLFLFFMPKNDKTKILVIRDGKENYYIISK